MGACHWPGDELLVCKIMSTCLAMLERRVDTSWPNSETLGCSSVPCHPNSEIRGWTPFRGDQRQFPHCKDLLHRPCPFSSSLIQPPMSFVVGVVKEEVEEFFSNAVCFHCEFKRILVPSYVCFFAFSTFTRVIQA